MKKNIFKIIFLSTILLSVFSCDKNSAEEIEETRRFGHKTLSFYMNGKLWQNSLKESSKGSINGSVEPSFSLHWLYIKDKPGAYNMTSYNLDKSDFYATLVNKRNENLPYCFDIEESNMPIVSIDDDKDKNHFYLTYKGVNYKSHDGSGVFILTEYDTISTGQLKDYVGTFTGVLYNENNSKDSLVITDGRFEMHY